VKFYLDEHIDPELGKLLEEEGFEVFYMNEEGEGRSDSFHLNHAVEIDAVIVTRDTDFLKLASEKEHNGVFQLTGFPEPEKVLEEMRPYFDEDLGEEFAIYI
jgi:predicted nuclease of predicted toxin-antitoxin system